MHKATEVVLFRVFFYKQILFCKRSKVLNSTSYIEIVN